MFKKLLLSSLIFAGSLTLHASVYDDTKISKKGNSSTSADYPEEMERNYDDLLQSWATSSTGVECDYNKEAAILFDDSVYMDRLHALPSQMELAYNQIVKRFIEMYAGRRREQVSFMLGQGTYYFPLFEEALDREGLPLELKYLPVIESALNPIARSRVGATGLWQFMAATGKQYKLEINSLVDERRDPYKSTQAAVKYLKDMYRVYGDWNLVIAAYNCGPGNVNKAIKRSGGKRDYWDIYPYLPKETRGYVPAFIAATYIMSYYPEHNICPAETDLPVLVDTLSINKLVHLEQIAEVINVSIDQIRKLNPQFKDDIIPGAYKEYALKLPLHNLTAFIDNEDSIYAHRSEELLTHKQMRTVASERNAPADGGYAMHKVKRGETLGGIASKYRVSIAQIKQWNSMASDRLSVGKSLKVSAYVAPRKVVEQQASAIAPKVQKGKTTEFIAEDGVLKRNTTVTKTITSYYKVQRGDTWTGISNKTGVSVANIKQWNGMKGLVADKNLKIHKTETVNELAEVAKPEEIRIAADISEVSSFLNTYIEELNIPKPTITMGLLNSQAIERNDKLEETNVVYHKVIYGETISQIADKYEVSVSDILMWNNITKNTSSQATRLLIILPIKTDDAQIAKKEQQVESVTAQI